MARTFVYVSAAQSGVIDIFSLDPAGRLTPVGCCPAGELVMPMAVSADRRHLMAAIRSEPWRLITFAIDPADGALSEVASAPLPASMPAVAALGDRFLIAASYASDMLALFAADADGAFRAPAAQTLPTGRNAHMALADRTGNHVFVPCLGSDEIRRFRMDHAAGKLTPVEPPVGIPAGFGPRHAVMAVDNSRLFLLGEFTGQVASFRFEPASGDLTLEGFASILPPGSSLTPGSVRPAAGGGETDRSKVVWAADIRITPDGRFLHATERTQSTIAALALDVASGKLSATAHVVTETQPRGIGIDPSGHYLVATGEKSDKVASYAIDPADGRLSLIGRAPVSAGANWVEIVSFD